MGEMGVCAEPEAWDHGQESKCLLLLLKDSFVLSWELQCCTWSIALVHWDLDVSFSGGLLLSHSHKEWDMLLPSLGGEASLGFAILLTMTKIIFPVTHMFMDPSRLELGSSLEMHLLLFVL